MTSNKLAVQETTNEVSNKYNHSLFSDNVLPDTVSEFMRAMIANYLATTAPQWAELFATLNSGTYNNQYMVLDMKLYTPGRPLKADTFWVLEQIPGLVVKADQTAHLQKHSYWASYNEPFYPEINLKSGNQYLVDKYGTWFFGYAGYARARLFARLQGDVADMDGMKRIMRYNNFKKDNESLILNCSGAPGGVCTPPYSGSLSIAARADLSPLPGKHHHFGPLAPYLSGGAFGATDAKITCWSLMKGADLKAHVISGPTRMNSGTYLPAFTWQGCGKQCNGTVHIGVPEVFDFDFVEMTPSTESYKVLPDSVGRPASELPDVSQIDLATYTLRRYKDTNSGKASLKFSADKKYGDVAVTVQHNPDVHGWALLTFTPAPALLKSDPLAAYYAAGWAEGFRTMLAINQTYANEVEGLWDETDTNSRDWINAHLAVMKTLAAAGKTPEDVQLGKLLQQLQGITDGFAAAKREELSSTTIMEFDLLHMFLISFQTEIYAVQKAANPAAAKKPAATRAARTRDAMRNQHCSALVKLTADDLFMGHDTWGDYSTMLRQYKTYAFETTVTMSSYPGSISSIDDWYMTSNRLAVQETTNGNYNDALYVKYTKPQTVSECFRVMLACYLATTAPQWTTIFATLNSGTYNNQYMVLDMKLYTPGQAKLAPHTFWVLEQNPGLIVSHDQSAHLERETYWASYNVPFYPAVYEAAGFAALKQQEGAWLWGYKEYARGAIFAQQQGTITDMEGFKRVLRNNNFRFDAASRIMNCSGNDFTNGAGERFRDVCDPPYSANLAIAMRGDLNPAGHYGPQAASLDGFAYGAIDTKAVAASMMLDPANLVGQAINGPTYDDQGTYLAPFQWSTCQFGNCDDVLRMGLADRFDFPFVEFNVSLFRYADGHAGDAPATNDMRTPLIILAVVLSVLAAAGIVATVVAVQRNSRNKSMEPMEDIQEELVA
jgi:hypothetical protein